MWHPLEAPSREVKKYNKAVVTAGCMISAVLAAIWPDYTLTILTIQGATNLIWIWS